MAMPGTYTARLTIAPASGAPTVLTQRVILARDPQQILTDLELKSLDAARLRVVEFQRALQSMQSKADSVSRRVADMRKAADSNAAKLTPELRAGLVALEKSMADVVRDVGAPPARAGGRGAPPVRPPVMDDDQPQAVGVTIRERAATLNELLNVTFAVSTGQQQLLTQLPVELAAQKTRVAKLETESVTALLAGFRVAGIEVQNPPVRGSTER